LWSRPLALVESALVELWDVRTGDRTSTSAGGLVEGVRTGAKQRCRRAGAAAKFVAEAGPERASLEVWDPGDLGQFGALSGQYFKDEASNRDSRSS
jgi:hypothetical protein